MITDTKFVKSVTSNTPKKGWKIEWMDGKKDNVFDNAYLAILEEAQKSNRMVTVTKEKNDAGYWNIQTLELATLEATPTPAQPTTQVRSQSTNASIEAQVAIKEVGECWRTDKMKGNEPEVMAYRAWIVDKLNTGEYNDKAIQENVGKDNKGMGLGEGGGPGRVFKDAGELMGYASSKGLSVNAVREKMGWGDKLITDEMLKEEKLKELWD